MGHRARNEVHPLEHIFQELWSRSTLASGQFHQPSRHGELTQLLSWWGAALPSVSLLVACGTAPSWKPIHWGILSEVPTAAFAAALFITL